MDPEKFTFVVLNHSGHRVEERYCTRREADKYFDHVVSVEQGPAAITVAYYCASAGGCVNAWSAPQ